MGRETVATLHRNGAASEGKALLETDEILFRGDSRLRIPLRTILSVRADGGLLTLSTRDGEIALDLGNEAAVWERAILNPRSLIDKLGIKDSHSVLLVDLADDELGGQIKRRTPNVTVSDSAGPFDVIVLQIDRPEGLGKIGACRRSIHDQGMLWAVTPKKTPGLMDIDVMAAARDAGLVDVKVARISDSLTALKLVVPKALRSAKPRP